MAAKSNVSFATPIVSHYIDSHWTYDEMDEFFTFHNIQRRHDRRQNSHDLPLFSPYDPSKAIIYFENNPTGDKADTTAPVSQLDDMAVFLDRLRALSHQVLQHAPYIFSVCHPFTTAYICYHNRIGQESPTAFRPHIWPKPSTNGSNVYHQTHYHSTKRRTDPLFIPTWPIPPQLEKRLLIHRLTQFHVWYKQYVGDQRPGFDHNYVDVIEHLRQTNTAGIYVEDPMKLFPGIKE